MNAQDIDILINDQTVIQQLAQNKDPNSVGLCVCAMLNESGTGAEAFEKMEAHWANEEQIFIKPLSFDDPWWDLCKVFGKTEEDSADHICVIMNVHVKKWDLISDDEEEGLEYLPKEMDCLDFTVSWSPAYDKMDEELKSQIEDWFHEVIDPNKQTLAYMILQGDFTKIVKPDGTIKYSEYDD